MKRLMQMAVSMALAALLLSGCMPKADLDPKEPILLTPAPDSVPPAPTQADAGREMQIAVWYPREEGASLSCAQMQISTESGSDLCAAALEAMLKLGEGQFPAETRLQSVEWAGDHLTVVSWLLPDLADQRAVYALLASCANTLGSLGSQATAFLVNGTAAYMQGWPLGALTLSDGDIDSQWARLTLDAERDECLRLSFVYRAADNGIFPQLTEIRLRRDDLFPDLIAAMASPSALPRSTAVFPADGSILSEMPEVVQDDQGQTVLRFRFDANLLAMLESQSVRAWQLYAATACASLLFVPQVQAVEMYVGSARVVRMDSPQGALLLEEGAMRWDDFAAIRLCQTRIFHPLSSGGVQAEICYMSAQQASSPVSLLMQALSDDAEAFPSLEEEDILGVTIFGREARVNLSDGFRDRCSLLSPEEEKSVIYAMVNTLCDLQDVRQVRFYVNGRSEEWFVSQISFFSPLMRNDGAIVSED